jgi:hypothetical protein
LHPDSKLAQVADTLNALSGDFAASNCRQKQRGENGNDGDDDEQFEEGEGATRVRMGIISAMMESLALANMRGAVVTPRPTFAIVE